MYRHLFVVEIGQGFLFKGDRVLLTIGFRFSWGSSLFSIVHRSLANQTFRCIATVYLITRPEIKSQKHIYQILRIDNDNHRYTITKVLYNYKLKLYLILFYPSVFIAVFSIGIVLSNRRRANLHVNGAGTYSPI